MVLREPGQGPQIVNLTTGSERAVANHLGFRVVPDHDEAVLVAAFAFGATDHMQAVYNEPSVNYVKLRQESGSTASIEYDAVRGYGYTDLTGLNPVPNDNSAAFNGDQIYAENIGVKGALGTIIFRVDVPNGVYRFVAAGGDAGEYNHVTKMRVRNGGTGLWVNLIDHEHVFRPTIWRVGFADKIPPPADGGGHDSGTYTDPTFRPLFNSCVVSVTGGYLEFQQIGKGVNSADLWGGDLCLLELWRMILPSPDIHVSPLEVVFPGTANGQPSDPFEIVVTNNGTGLLTYATGVVGTDAAEFEIVAGAAGSVSPTEQAPVQLRFTPTRTGPASAALEISSDDPDEPVVSVPLSGYGLSDPPPDLDEDGDVDLEDYAMFADCLGGPLVPGPADSDGDGDADLDDFEFWLPCMGGPGIAIDESCSVMDLDMDEDVDLADFSLLTEVFTGALEGPLPPGCRASDFDSDRDVDLLDFAEMQASFAR